MPPQNLTSRVAQAAWAKRHPQWAQPKPGERFPQIDITPLRATRYVADKLALGVRTKLRGRQPWITFDAVAVLDDVLGPDDVGLEWGSGGTTLWFAPRVKQVHSVEAVPGWHGILSGQLRDQRITNADVRLVSVDDLGYETPEHRAAYVGAFPEIAAGSLGFVLVDGEYRDACALRALDLLKPGGVLVLDNAEAYLPSTTRSPWRLDAPANAGWATFLERVEGWRSIWTTNGIWDTTLWFKP